MEDRTDTKDDKGLKHDAPTQ